MYSQQVTLVHMQYLNSLLEKWFMYLCYKYGQKCFFLPFPFHLHLDQMFENFYTGRKYICDMLE